MHKWIIATLLGFIIQESSMIGSLAASQHEEPSNVVRNIEVVNRHRSHSGSQEIFASYWLTYQPSLVNGQNVLFNLQQTLQGIEYDSTTGIFTAPPGVYAINFFGTPNLEFRNTLNLNVNGTIIPTPNIEGSMIVIQLSEDRNEVSVQATGAWSPQTGDIGSFFFAYASIAIYKIGNEVAP